MIYLQTQKSEKRLELSREFEHKSDEADITSKYQHPSTNTSIPSKLTNVPVVSSKTRKTKTKFDKRKIVSNKRA